MLAECNNQCKIDYTFKLTSDMGEGRENLHEYLNTQWLGGWETTSKISAKEIPKEFIKEKFTLTEGENPRN